MSSCWFELHMYVHMYVIYLYICIFYHKPHETKFIPHIFYYKPHETEFLPIGSDCPPTQRYFFHLFPLLLRPLWPLQDEVTLLVENQPLEVSRYQLMGASPVFKAMLDSGFKEGQSREIVLPEKKYDAVQFMVDYITSGFTTPITGKTPGAPFTNRV